TTGMLDQALRMNAIGIAGREGLASDRAGENSAIAPAQEGCGRGGICMRRTAFLLWLLGLTATTTVAVFAADWKKIHTPADGGRLDRLAESIKQGDAAAAASNPAPADTNVLRAILDPPDRPIAIDRLSGNVRGRTF